MKVVLLALFVVAVTAAPLPDSGNDAVEMIVNGVPDGAALELGGIVDIKLKEHSDGGVVATNLLHPYTAVGIAEAEAAAAAAAAADAASSSPNEVSVVDNPIASDPQPMPIAIPQIPIVPKPDIENPVAEPEQLPEQLPVQLPEQLPVQQPEQLPVQLPEQLPVQLPEQLPVQLPEQLPEQLPVAAPQFNGEVYNDGHVQVQYNGPTEPGMLATLQDWFNVVVNYFNSATSPAAPVNVVPMAAQPRQ